MNIKISIEELNLKKSRELIPIECNHCKIVFYRAKNQVLAGLNGNNKTRLKYCSQSCSSKDHPKIPHTIETSCQECNIKIFLTKGRIREKNFCSRKCTAKYYAKFKRKTKTVKPKRIWAKILNLNCSFCHKDLQRTSGEYKLSKTKTFFCNKSCKTKYANAYQIIHKPRSRAEKLLVSLIKESFPVLEVQENIRNILPGRLEIDIYIPKLKLAIELNGPFHYLPIFGQEKLLKIKNKDLLKQIEISQLGLNLIIIDISKLNSRQSTDLFIKEYFSSHIKPIIEVG